MVDLPRVALILALGLAVPGAGARAVARQARGLLVRAAVRWPSGDVLLADRAALLCTRGTGNGGAVPPPDLPWGYWSG